MGRESSLSIFRRGLLSSNWPSGAALGLSVDILFWFWFWFWLRGLVSAGGLEAPVSQARKQPVYAVQTAHRGQEHAHPIHSSVGGRPKGLTHSGDPRRCSRTLSAYCIVIVAARRCGWASALVRRGVSGW